MFSCILYCLFSDDFSPQYLAARFFLERPLISPTRILIYIPMNDL